MAKAVDLKAAKERKQKKIVAVGGVLFVILLFVQVPRTLRMMNDGAEEPATAAPVTTAPGSATPAAGLPLPVASDPTAGAEGVVTASLVSFSRFASKDPFVQQVKDEGSSAQEAPPAQPTGEEPEGAIAGSEPDDDGAAPPAEPVQKTQAEIEVNGVAETVSVDSPFPVDNPMFLLVKVTPKSVGIKVAEGGSFASGEPTLTLSLGKPVTLVNTADGTRFVLRLKAVP